MDSWQVVLGLFFVLLPVVLMVDFWGDERLTSRGRPVPRPWLRPRVRSIDTVASHDPSPEHHAASLRLDEH